MNGTTSQTAPSWRVEELKPGSLASGMCIRILGQSGSGWLGGSSSAEWLVHLLQLLKEGHTGLGALQGELQERREGR